MEARLPQEPAVNGGVLAGGVVVEDQVDVQIGGNGRVDAREKPTKFLGAMSDVARSDHGSSFHVQGGEERRRACVGRASPGAAATAAPSDPAPESDSSRPRKAPTRDRADAGTTRRCLGLCR